MYLVSIATAVPRVDSYIWLTEDTFSSSEADLTITNSILFHEITMLENRPLFACKPYVLTHTFLHQ